MFNPNELFTMPKLVTSFLILVSVAAAKDTTVVSAPPIEAAQQVGGAAAIHLASIAAVVCHIRYACISLSIVNWTANLLNSYDFRHSQEALSLLQTFSASSSQECSATSQRLGLVLLYNSTDGPGWSKSSGWPSIPGLSSMDVSSLEQYMVAIPLQSGSCVTSTGAVDGSMEVLPDHCCWEGVSCCSPLTCGNDPYCNCTVGLVTSIELSRNQVRCRCLQHA